MPRYEQVVIETRTYRVRYVVDAKDKDEARDKIAIGDTLEEQDLAIQDVLNRDEYGELKKIKKAKDAEDRAACANCRKTWPESKLNEPKDLSQRIDPGGEVPSGECPKCGALCYPK